MLLPALQRYIHITSGQAIIDLCRPLAEHFGIHYLLYVRDYKNGKRLWLTTHGNWTEHFYQHELYQISAFENSFILYKPGYYLWDALPGQKVFNMAREFNIAHGMTIVTDKQDYYEFFHFATSIDNLPILNFYMNNLDVLQRFMAYFVDQGKKLIHNAYQHMTNVPQPNLAEDHNSNDDFNVHKNVNDFIWHINANKCYLKNLTEEVCLTKREGQCLSWFLKGKTMNEIAIIEGISKRTVEAHTEQAKRKLGCYKSFQLGYKLAKMGFIQ